MSQRRQRRRKTTQYTGILRGNRETRAADKRRSSSEAQIVERGVKIRWRLVSGTIAVCCVAMLALFFTSDIFYVRSITVSNLNYMTREEVFTYADIANQHILRVNPDEVRDNILEYQTVADARVQLGWPPRMVNIVIEERQPALVWEQNGTVVWADIRGNIMAQRAERPDLVRILVTDPTFEGGVSDGSRLDIEIVYGVLQLHELLPDVGIWSFDDVNGLGFVNDEGVRVWFGTGQNMDERLDIYRGLRSRYQTRGFGVSEINVVNPDAPFVRR